jgi:hypothetical protein
MHEGSPEGSTPRTGMHSTSSRRPPAQMDPCEVGRLSQATKVAQAKHDH